MGKYYLMKKAIENLPITIVMLIMSVFFPSEAESASGWTVNPADYRYDMSLYFRMSFASGTERIDCDGYEVAAFSGDECRGVAEILPGVEDCMYMRIRSNVPLGENVTFKLKKRENGQVIEVEGVTVPFESDSVLGLPSDPYEVVVRRYFNVEITSAHGGTVNFDNGRYEEGSELNVTAVPDEGYSFEEWSDGVMDASRIIVVNDNVSLEARFSVNTYRLTYLVDGEEYKVLDVAYGAEVTAEPFPEREGHTFSGWDGVPDRMPAHDVEVSGTFSVNTYRLTYLVDGEEYKALDVAYGAEVTAEPSPEREGHTFSGWDGVPDRMPAHDVEVTGYFTVNLYKLTVYLDNEVYFETELEMGAPVEIPEPSVPADRKFDGWVEEVPETMPAHDLEIHGTTSVSSVLTSVFKDEDALLTVYNINGVLLLRDVTIREASERLSKGIYIINGKKIRI